MHVEIYVHFFYFIICVIMTLFVYKFILIRSWAFWCLFTLFSSYWEQIWELYWFTRLLGSLVCAKGLFQRKYTLKPTYLSMSINLRRRFSRTLIRQFWYFGIFAWMNYGFLYKLHSENPWFDWIKLCQPLFLPKRKIGKTLILTEIFFFKNVFDQNF